MYSRANITAELERNILQCSTGRPDFSRPQEEIFARPITRVCRTCLKNKVLHPAEMISLLQSDGYRAVTDPEDISPTEITYSPVKDTGAASNTIISRMSL